MREKPAELEKVGGRVFPPGKARSHSLHMLFDRTIRERSPEVIVS